MLFINKTDSEITKALETHIKNVSCRVRRKAIGQKCTDSNCKICKNRCDKLPNVPLDLEDIIRDDFLLDSILRSSPKDLYTMSEMVWEKLIPNFSWENYSAFLDAKRIDSIKRTHAQQNVYDIYIENYNLLFKIFDYDVWFQNQSNQPRYDAYTLAENLDRNTCTYCNRLYTSTMRTRRGEKVMRTTFDHWHSHARHPLLGLSFFNLIPSCTTCNSSVKGFKEYLITSHLHPYVDENCNDLFRYSYDFFKTTNTLDVKIVANAGGVKVFNTYNDLKLREAYNAHHSELRDLIKIKEAYSNNYIETIKRIYQNAGLSKKEIYRLAFGVEFDVKDFHKRPLSKFKRDILKELKMLDFE